MALLEKLESGKVYMVKISASNQAGDGPFSNMVELPVLRGKTHQSKNPRHTYSQTESTGTNGIIFLSLFAYLRQRFPLQMFVVNFVNIMGAIQFSHLQWRKKKLLQTCNTNRIFEEDCHALL